MGSAIRNIVKARDVEALRATVKNAKTTQELLGIFREIEVIKEEERSEDKDEPG